MNFTLRKHKKASFAIGALAFLLILLPLSAHAAGAGLAWETPLETIVTSLTGPIARNIAILAIACAGIALAFGGEMGEFTRRIIFLVLAVGVIMFAANLLTSLFPASSGSLLF